MQFEGGLLFAAGPLGDDGRDHLRLVLVDRVEAWLRSCARPMERDDATNLHQIIVEHCALIPIKLDQSRAVAWKVFADTSGDGPARLRAEKIVYYSGDEALFGLSPRADLTDAPRAIVTPSTLRFVASAPWEDFAAVRDAIEAAEQRVHRFLCWQHLDVADVNRDLPEIASERLEMWRRQKGAAAPDRRLIASART